MILTNQVPDPCENLRMIARLEKVQLFGAQSPTVEQISTNEWP